jgi:hypothetical protein
MSLKKLLHGGMGYFFVELPEGTILAHSLEPGEKMPMQFGREVGNSHLKYKHILLYFLEPVTIG